MLVTDGGRPTIVREIPTSQCRVAAPCELWVCSKEIIAAQEVQVNNLRDKTESSHGCLNVKFVILNAKFIILNTKFIIFKTKFI